MMLCLLATSFVSSSCNDDGNETISLEFGNIRSMIIGRWYTVGGVYWDFYDGYYIRSDKGNGQLRWYLDDTYNSERPYFGYIYLSGTPYSIISMGGGSWIIRDTKGGTIEFTRDGSGDSGSNSGIGDNSSSSGSSLLVKRIEKRLSNTLKLSVDFEYDSRQLVSRATYTNTDRVEYIWPCSSTGTTVHYTVTNGTLNITYTRDGRNYNVGNATIDAQNHITLIYEGNSPYYFGHNDKGQCTSLRYGDSSRPTVYTWEDDCITNISSNVGGTSHLTEHSTIVNPANLNLNWMIDDQMFGEDQFGLTLCGYVSAKEKYLLKLPWKLENGRPVSVQYGNYTYYIYYY